MNIIILKEIRDIFLTLIVACKKNFREFMIVSLMSAFGTICYFYMDLSKSVHILSNQAAESQYSKDTSLINFLKLRVSKLENQVEESNKYTNSIRDKLELNNQKKDDKK